MMRMYNEIYGAYYYMMGRILEKASEGPVTAREIDEIVSAYGFAESALYFTPDALSQDGSGYNLLKKTQNGYVSILRNKPAKCLTQDQKRLVKTLLKDKRIRLFMGDADIESFESILKGAEPLYDINDIILTETAADGDDYGDEGYRVRFKTLLQAIKRNQVLRIVYDSSRGERKTVKIAPYKLEYGLRDDKFRLCGVSIFRDKPSRYIKLNIARMISIIPAETRTDIDFERFIEMKMLKSPIDIEISDFRNGFERIFIGLSNYKRTSVFNEETGKCTMRIYCMDDDVQELLIMMLSFGPAIRVIGPEDFREKYVDRVKKQMEMLKTGE